MNIQQREEVIVSVIRKTGRTRDEVAEEVDRQLHADIDGFAGETPAVAVNQLAFYCDAASYDRYREAEASRLGIRVETLDRLVEEERARLAGDGPRGRERYKAIARRAGLLLHRGVDPIIAYELVAAWNLAACHPPLPADEMQRVLDHVADREMQRGRAA
jgi:hypothetical protein